MRIFKTAVEVLLYHLPYNYSASSRGTSLTLRLIGRLQGCVNPTQGRAKTRSKSKQPKKKKTI